VGPQSLAPSRFTHGAIFTLGTTDRDLPVNKRFYPGGENSLRGYVEGEASPRGPLGTFLGAKAYTLLNLELEQAVTKDLSLSPSPIRLAPPRNWPAIPPTNISSRSASDSAIRRS